MAPLRLTLDRGDSHVSDAGSWEKACTHIGVFLAWAAKRGLASGQHREQLARLVATPGSYVVGACDSKLGPDDFEPEAERVVRNIYDRYLPHYSNVIVSATNEAYILGLDSDLVAELEGALDEWLQQLGPQLVPSAQTPSKNVQAPRHAVHPKFGRGVVVAEEGDGDGRKLTINFEDAGTKTLLARFVEVSEPPK